MAVDWTIWVSAPLVAAFVGWVTNWLAVKMIFYPQRFIGIGPIGWQGVLPKRAQQFAHDVAEMLTKRLVTPRELADRLDPAEMERIVERVLDREAPVLIAECAELVAPGAWAMLPEEARAAVIAQVRREAGSLARELFVELRALSPELLDFHALIMSRLTGSETKRLVRLFQEVGRKELFAIEYLGGVFGAVIGLLQAAAWTFLDRWWLMPVVGAIVGLITNWLAIQMIFRPQERRGIGPFSYQGLFAKRQAEIARDYGRVSATEVLTAKNILMMVTEGPGGAVIAARVTEAVSRRIDDVWAKARGLVPIEVTPETLARVKQLVVQRIAVAAPGAQPEIEAYLERTLDIEKTIERKLASLSKPEFERVLRGLFEEDEFILIVIGGVLGAAVGLVQAVWTLGGLPG